MSRTAFVFPGQGSQFVGMGKDFFDHIPWVKDVYAQAESLAGFKVADVSFSGPEEMLKNTRYTQPALFVACHVVSRLLGQAGFAADGAAGHSLGEYAAVGYAGGFSFEDGLRMVCERARLMDEAGKGQPGCMAAVIGLAPDQVMDVCVEARETGIVQPANYNSPQQVVISGSKEGVEAAVKLAKSKGARKVVVLPVSGAFHSPLMSAAMNQYGKLLDTVKIQMVRIPVYANVTASPVSTAEEIRTLLHHQLTHPVRWIETIRNMVKDGITRFLEVGPGTVLTGLIKRISVGIETDSCGTWEDWNRLKGEGLWKAGHPGRQT